MKKPLLTSMGLVALLSGSIFIASCDKSDNNNPTPPPGGTAKVAAVNASPLTGPASVNIGGTTLSSNPLPLLGTTGSAGNPYVSVSSGTPNVQVTAGGATIVDGTTTLGADANYTVLVYDTINGGGAGKVRAITLNDDLTAPSAGNAKVRFVHLAPDAPAVTIDVFKGADSTRLVDSASYIIQPSDVTDVSAFTTVSAGDYQVKVKLPTMNDSTIISIPTLSLADGKIYTIYATGLYRLNAAGTPNDPNALQTGVVQHN